MEGVEESKTAIDDDERRPWENSEFEQNLTFELADGGTVCVNRCILSTYSALVRDCPSLDEPIPIPQGVGSTAALSTLLRVVYSHALVREQFAFAYDVFDVVAEIYELAVFMGCHKIVENLRAEMKDSLSKIVDMNQFSIDHVRVLDRVFSALIVVESVTRGHLWTKDEFVCLYRVVQFGGEHKNFSEANAKRLTPRTMLSLLRVASQTESMRVRINGEMTRQPSWFPCVEGIELKDA